MKSCFVLAQIKSINTSSIYYLCCQICFSKVSSSQEEYICYKCNLQILNPLPRFKFSFEIFDGSALARVVIFGNALNKFIGTNAIQFLKWKKLIIHEYNISEEMLNAIIAENIKDYFIVEWFYFKFNLKNMLSTKNSFIYTQYLNFSTPIINLKRILLFCSDIEGLGSLNFYKAAKLGSFSTIIYKTNLILKKQKFIKFQISRIETPNKFKKNKLVNKNGANWEKKLDLSIKYSKKLNRRNINLRLYKKIKFDSFNGYQNTLSKHKKDLNDLQSSDSSLQSKGKLNKYTQIMNEKDSIVVDGFKKHCTTIVSAINLNDSCDLFSPQINSFKSSIVASTPNPTNNKPPNYLDDIYRDQSPILLIDSKRTSSYFNNLNDLADVLSYKLEYIKSSVVFRCGEVTNILPENYFKNHSPMISSNNKFKSKLEDQSMCTPTVTHLGFNISSLFTETNKICENQSNDLFE